MTVKDSVVFVAVVVVVLSVCSQSSADAAGRVTTRRGWGKRTMDDLDDVTNDVSPQKRRGWGKRSNSNNDGLTNNDDVMSKRRGWGKRSDDVTADDAELADDLQEAAKPRGWGKRADFAPMTPSSGVASKRRGWGKRSVNDAIYDDLLEENRKRIAVTDDFVTQLNHQQRLARLAWLLSDRSDAMAQDTCEDLLTHWCGGNTQQILVRLWIKA